MAERTTPGYAGFARLYWMFLGPMLSLLALISVVNDGGGWVTTRNLVFFAMAALLLVCRWAEFHAGDARTSEGEPATPAHLRRYLLMAALLGAAAWIAANLAGRFVAGT
jgi:hypothetical protein